MKTATSLKKQGYTLPVNAKGRLPTSNFDDNQFDNGSILKRDRQTGKLQGHAVYSNGKTLRIDSEAFLEFWCEVNLDDVEPPTKKQKMSIMDQFFEWIDVDTGGTFKNCTLIKDLDEFKAGDEFECVVVHGKTSIMELYHDETDTSPVARFQVSTIATRV